MLTIDVFISASPDTQYERAIIEQILGSLANEFNLPLLTRYSSRLRRVEKAGAASAGYHPDDSRPLSLRVCYWEHESDDSTQVLPNTGQYDLVISLINGSVGSRPADKLVLPNGKPPESTIDYEIAWALDTSRVLRGASSLKIFRRVGPSLLLLDAGQTHTEGVEGFFGRWRDLGGKAFAETVFGFSSAAEFEAVARRELRLFLRRQLNEKDLRLPGVADRSRERARSLPGLRCFEFGNAADFGGRTDRVEAALSLLRSQAEEDFSSFLVIGPNGSGKSSFVRAGVLPLIVQSEMIPGYGPWGRIITRPSAVQAGQAPLIGLASALLGEAALTECRPPTRFADHHQLAEAFESDPTQAAIDFVRPLTELNFGSLDEQLDFQESAFNQFALREALEIKQQTKLSSRKHRPCLALVIDQLEELFAPHISPAERAAYLAAVRALIATGRVFVLATIRSDWLPELYRESADAAALLNTSAVLEISHPEKAELADIVRSALAAQGIQIAATVDLAGQLAGLPGRERLSRAAHLISRLCAGGKRVIEQADIDDLGGVNDCLQFDLQDFYLAHEPREQEWLDETFLTLFRAKVGDADSAIHTPVGLDRLQSHPTGSDGEEPLPKRIVCELVQENFARLDYDPEHRPLLSLANNRLGTWWQASRKIDQAVEQGGSRVLAFGAACSAPTVVPSPEPTAGNGYPVSKTALPRDQRWLWPFLTSVSLALFICLIALGVHRSEKDRHKKQVAKTSVQKPSVIASTMSTPAQTPEPSPAAKPAAEPSILDVSSRSLNTAELPPSSGHVVQVPSTSGVPLLPSASGDRFSAGGEIASEGGLKNQPLTGLPGQGEAASNQNQAPNPTEATSPLSNEAASANYAPETLVGLSQPPAAASSEPSTSSLPDTASLSSGKAAAENEASAQKGLAERPQPAENAPDPTSAPTSSPPLSSGKIAAGDEVAQKALVTPPQPPETASSPLAPSGPLQAPSSLPNQAATEAQKALVTLPQSPASKPSPTFSPGSDQAASSGSGKIAAETPANEKPLSAPPATQTVPGHVEIAPSASRSSSSELAMAQPTPMQLSITKVITKPKTPEKTAKENSSVRTATEDIPTKAAAESTPAKVPGENRSNGVAFESHVNKTDPEKFVQDYMNSVTANEPSAQRRFLADRVNFYGHASQGGNQVESLIRDYQRQWPNRKWIAVGRPRLIRSGDRNRFQIVQPFQWSVSRADRSAHGEGSLSIQVRRSRQGELQIVSIRQLRQ
jgi:hypothetical protein